MHDTSLIDSLLHVMRTLRHHFDDCARGMGLTMSRARVITTLARHDGLSQRELATMLDIEAPTLKRQLDALERDGFVIREAIEGDARKKAVCLTQKAKDSEVTEFGRKLRSEVLQGISDEDLALTKRVLDQIATNIAERASK